MCPTRTMYKNFLVKEGVINKYNEIQNLKNLGKVHKELKGFAKELGVETNQRAFWTLNNKLMFNESFFETVDQARDGIKPSILPQNEEDKVFEDLTDSERLEKKDSPINRMQEVKERGLKKTSKVITLDNLISLPTLPNNLEEALKAMIDNGELKTECK